MSSILGYYWLILLFMICGEISGLLFTSTKPSKVPVNVVSFDLDDTLWRTEKVVKEANKKIEELYGLDPEKVHSKMKEIRLRESVLPSYTVMRTTAYRELGLGDGAEKAFDQWVEARNKAAEADLFPDVIPCLQEFQQSGWLICSITNGRGSALGIPSLAHFFSVEVSGEDENIFPHRKPDPQIFQAAVDKLRHQFGWNGELGNWYHIGDCGVNDVKGASEFGMKTILLLRDEEINGENSFKDTGDSKFYSTLTVDEQIARRNAALSAKPDYICNELYGLCSNLKPATFVAPLNTTKAATNKQSFLRKILKRIRRRFTHEKKENVVRQYFDGVTMKDFAQIADCFAERVELVDICGPSKGATREATNIQMAERVKEFVEAHPDCIVDFHHPPSCSYGSDWVWCHWFEVGTWAGESLGIQPRGTPLEVEGQTRFLVNDDNKITKLVVTRTFSEWEIQAAKPALKEKSLPVETK